MNKTVTIKDVLKQKHDKGIFQEGDWIIAGRPNPNTGDRSLLNDPVLILHVAPKHLIIKGRFGNHAIAFSESKDMDFGIATEKTIELLGIKH